MQKEYEERQQLSPHPLSLHLSPLAMIRHMHANQSWLDDWEMTICLGLVGMVGFLGRRRGVVVQCQGHHYQTMGTVLNMAHWHHPTSNNQRYEKYFESLMVGSTRRIRALVVAPLIAQ